MQTDWAFLSSFILLLHICGVIAAMHAILYARNAQSAIAWTLSLLLIPHITLLPYLLLGRSRIARDISARRFEDIQSNVQLKRSNPFRKRINKIKFPTQQLPIDFSRHTINSGQHRMHALASLAHTPLLSDNTVRLLINGEQTFAALFTAIAQAQKIVIVQSFSVRDDQVGKQLHTLLCQRAQAGVAVYFLYDAIGSYRLPLAYINTLRTQGVQAHAFSTGRHFHHPLQINFRNHRKLSIVDGHTAFLGGFNISDIYLGAHPRLSPWRDTHVQVKGPAVAALQLAFAKDWFWITQTLPELILPTYPIKTHAPQSIANTMQPEHAMLCQVLPSGPTDNQETCLLFFVEAINSARTRIWLASPYFIPDDAIRTALQLAVLRGVDVRLLLPSQADHLTVFAASTLYAHEMIQVGVKVYRYHPGFMHQKIVLIDQDTAAIGSANLDHRSFRLNFEITLITVDAGFAHSVATMLENDFATSRLMSMREYEDAPGWKKFAMHLAKLFSPIL
ncbi:MAG: cardiolipin synthase [Ottowia sp.]|nr:cardiolipin synthase [Ottowia sp.]